MVLVNLKPSLAVEELISALLPGEVVPMPTLPSVLTDNPLIADPAAGVPVVKATIPVAGFHKPTPVSPLNE